jgi:hypothetical protein
MQIGSPTPPSDVETAPHILEELTNRRVDVVVMGPVVCDPIDDELYFVILSGQRGLQGSVVADRFSKSERGLHEMRAHLLGGLIGQTRVEVYVFDDELSAAHVAAGLWPEFQPVLQAMLMEQAERARPITLH